MAEQDALLRFCTAQRELTRLDDATSVQRRTHSRSVATSRELLREQMTRANATCVPVMCGGKQKYAVLRTPTTTGAVTCDAVIHMLTNLRYDDVQHANRASREGKVTLEDCVDAALRSSFAEPPADAPRKHARLAIVTKCPEPEHRPVHPACMSRIQETADSIHAASEAAKALRSQNDTRRKELRAICRDTEERVANHLARHDPEHGTRRVRLVDGSSRGNHESTFYLRRKNVVRSSRPTVRTALPAIRQTIRKLREDAGVHEDPSWDAFRWLTSPGTLATLRRHVSECLERLSTQKTSTRVVLTAV